MPYRHISESCRIHRQKSKCHRRSGCDGSGERLKIQVAPDSIVESIILAMLIFKVMYSVDLALLNCLKQKGSRPECCHVCACACGCVWVWVWVGGCVCVFFPTPSTLIRSAGELARESVLTAIVLAHFDVRCQFDGLTNLECSVEPLL